MKLAAVLEQPRPMWQRRTVPSDDPRDPQVRLPLRTELFLIAHHDETGKQHLSRHALNHGLAGTILLELSLTRRIQIGKQFQVRGNGYIQDSGRITIIDPTLYGEPITDAAMTLLRRTGGALRVSDFIAAFATPDLYDRIQGDMLATGILKRETHRRFGLFRREKYLPTKKAHPVRARTKIRDLPEPRHPDDPHLELPDLQTIALAGVVAALGLARHMYHPEPATLHKKLMDLIHRLHDNTVRDVAAAINPTRIR
ncbi:MAG TPA: GPP34 family phosphoprotein [Micromonosporaceae bacterium]|jgi:hypothetical protein|nr:GPP34 family phosphoprotein [Micromonosporaceae bacterium]